MKQKEESREAATPDLTQTAAAYAAAAKCRPFRAHCFFTSGSWGSRPRLDCVALSALNCLRPVFSERGSRLGLGSRDPGVGQWRREVEAEELRVFADDRGREDVEHVIVGLFWKPIAVLEQDLPEVAFAGALRQ